MNFIKQLFNLSFMYALGRVCGDEVTGIHVVVCNFDNKPPTIIENRLTQQYTAVVVSYVAE